MSDVVVVKGAITASVLGCFMVGTTLSVKESGSDKKGGRTSLHNGGVTTDRVIGEMSHCK